MAIFPTDTSASDCGHPNAIEFNLAKILFLIDKAVETRTSNRPPNRIPPVAANDDSSKADRSA